MSVISRMAVGFLALVSLACGLLGTAMALDNTTTPATAANYNRLKAVAEHRGWRTHVGDANDWNLQIFPKEGEKIIFNTNLNSDTIEYMCEGGRFDEDDDLCASEVRSVCVEGFGESCEDFD